MAKELGAMTFDEMVDENLARMIHELAKGTPWRSIIFETMDLTLRWREAVIANKEVKSNE